MSFLFWSAVKKSVNHEIREHVRYTPPDIIPFVAYSKWEQKEVVGDRKSWIRSPICLVPPCDRKCLICGWWPLVCPTIKKGEMIFGRIIYSGGRRIGGGEVKTGGRRSMRTSGCPFLVSPPLPLAQLSYRTTAPPPVSLLPPGIEDLPIEEQQKILAVLAEAESVSPLPAPAQHMT